MTDTTYARLAAGFDKHHKDPRGLTYITGFQVVERLNEVLGPGNWTYAVKEHGYDAESDEVWALGYLTATIDGAPTWREQFGSQKHNRRRADNKVIDYGFDLKGAATDALKKCATLIGVGLYLSEKEGGIEQHVAEPAPAAPTLAPVTFLCETCKQPIIAQDGILINAQQADTIRERFGALICRDHRPKKATA